MDDLDAKSIQERTHPADLALIVSALAVTCLALSLLIADGLDAREDGLHVKRTTVDNALAPEKTPGQLAAEVTRPKQAARQPRLSCAAINAAIAKGKTLEMVAAELQVTPERAHYCDDCRSAETVDSEIAVLRSPGDVDGDGKNDRVTLEVKDCDHVLIARLTRVGVRRSLFEEAISYPYPRILGVVDINRDGKGEAFVEISRGASTMSVALFTLVNDELIQVTLDGSPVSLGVGGSVTHLDSIGCGTGKLVTTSLLTSSGDSQADDRNTGERAVYALEGSRLRLLKKTTHVFGPCTDATKGCPSPKELRAARYDIDCDPIPFH